MLGTQDSALAEYNFLTSYHWIYITIAVIIIIKIIINNHIIINVRENSMNGKKRTHENEHLFNHQESDKTVKNVLTIIIILIITIYRYYLH